MKQKLSLEQKFSNTRVKGALQNRAQLLMDSLKAEEGSALVGKVAEVGRHTAQLVIEMKEGIPLHYDAAVPIFGPSSKLARKISDKRTKTKNVDPYKAIDQLLSENDG